MRTPNSITNAHRETGLAWDDTAAKYENEEADETAFLLGGGNSLLAPEREVLGDLSPWCGRAIHLQCAGGVDTLSLLRQGASEVVGVDISPRMIAVAARKAAALNARASWHVADILHMPSELDDTADLVYTGRGALPWMADLSAWASVIHRLLKPGGRLYIFEGHPLDWVWDETAPHYRLNTASGGYFSQTTRHDRWPAPLLEEQGSSARAHEHHWKLSDILNAVIGAGLHLERVEEHPDLYWNQFPQLPNELARLLPHTFSLLARKPGEI